SLSGDREVVGPQLPAVCRRDLLGALLSDPVATVALDISESFIETVTSTSAAPAGASTAATSVTASVGSTTTTSSGNVNSSSTSGSSSGAAGGDVISPPASAFPALFGWVVASDATHLSLA